MSIFKGTAYTGTMQEGKYNQGPVGAKWLSGKPTDSNTANSKKLKNSNFGKPITSCKGCGGKM